MPLQVGLFKRALHNLIMNAIQAMPAGGGLGVSIKSAENNIIITISDTGKGIPKAVQKKIFQPFVKGRKGGTGLGLYMVHYVITKVHQGNISFVSEDGKGTSFTITLPLNDCA